MPRWAWIWMAGALVYDKWGWPGAVTLVAAHLVWSLAAWRYRAWRDAHG